MHRRRWLLRGRLPAVAALGIRALVPLLAGSMVALLPQRLLHAQVPVPPVFEEGIVEVVAERLAPITVIVLVDSSGTMLLPVQQLLRHFGYVPRTDGETTAIPGLDGVRVVLDTRAGTLTIGPVVENLAPAEIIARGGEVYLRADRLAAMLEAELSFHAASLTWIVTRRTALPAQQRVIAEQRRAMLLAHQRHAVAEAHDSVRYLAKTGAGVLDWEVSTVGLDPGSRTSARTRLSSAVLGGDLAVGFGLDMDRITSNPFRDGVLRYHRVFPRSRLVSQVRAGNITTSGVFSRFVRGVELGNRPFHPGTVTGDIVLRPDLPTGWEYEVFQGNHLLGFSEPGDRDGVSIPLRSGTTPVQVRLLGPAGEEVVTTLLYQAPVSLLPRHRFEYVVAAGRCEGRTCETFAHADARLGATSFLTVGGGVEYVADSAGSRARPYAVSSFTTGTDLTGELQVMPDALSSATLGLYPRDGSVLRARASRSRPGFGAVSVVPAGLARWDTELTWDERIRRAPGSPAGFAGRLPIHSLRLTAGAMGSDDRGLARWRATAGVGMRAGFTELRYEHERLAHRPHLLGVRTSFVAAGAARARAIRPLINLTIAGDGHGFRIFEFGGSLQPAPAHVLSAGFSWSHENRRPGISLGWIARTGGTMSTVRATTGRPGATTAITVSGSTANDPLGNFTTRASTLSGYAGIAGVVYVDQDGDGTFSEGDDVVPGAALVAGGIPVVADSLGRFSVWGIQPYAVTALAVDSARIPDPSWASAVPVIRVRPVPNHALRVDVPLVRTRELIGTVIAGTGIPTAGGIALLITDVESGESASARTFSDGQFYISRVRPGRYRLEIAPSSLDALRARPEPASLEFVVPATGDNPVVELPPVRLVPTTS